MFCLCGACEAGSAGPRGANICILQAIVQLLNLLGLFINHSLLKVVHFLIYLVETFLHHLLKLLKLFKDEVFQAHLRLFSLLVAFINLQMK